MRRWDVVPGVRIGPLVLGMTEAELSAAWAAIPREARCADGMYDGAPPAPVLPRFDDAARATRIAVVIEQPVPMMLHGLDLRRRPDHEVDTLLRTLGAIEGSYGGARVPSAGVGVSKWERGDADYLMVDVSAPTEPIVPLPRLDPSDVLGRLLIDVYDRPDDDQVRLVYADALIEAGDPRGEFIVRQLRGDPAPELVARHGRRWLGELATVLAEYRFDRGFLAAARIGTPGALTDHHAWGTLRELEIEEAALSNAVDFLANQARPPLEKLHFILRASDAWDHGGDITATPYSGGVWELRVEHSTITALGACRSFPNLRELVVEGPPGVWVDQLAKAMASRRIAYRYQAT